MERGADKFNIKNSLKEEDKQKLLKMSEISLWLDHYDDIFSDFDPRPYSQRALSVDFLDEVKRASKDKPLEYLELKFLVPKDEREVSREFIIKKRLRDHFKRHISLLQKEKKDIINQGLLFIAFGIILMFIATYILIQLEKNLLNSFLVVLLEPGGWFLFWEGLNEIIFGSKKVKPDIDFYKKMSGCRIDFLSY